MAIDLQCKMCGGKLVLKEGSTIAQCDSCEKQQTIPKVDDEKKLALFARANRLRAACEFDKAAGIFETIVADFPQEAEAYWGLVLCQYGIEYVEDPMTHNRIPTCHRSSFASVMDDNNFDLALENADVLSRKLYREEAKQIEEIRKGIIEVSGKEEPYDIFICYKETAEDGQRTIDSVMAQDLYDELTAKGYRVFFARITLEDKLGQEYEPYIFAALNSAKIMLVVGTDYEYFNAVWVKNEWSRFLKLMAADKSKHLIPCYKGIDAYDMPKEFGRLQAQDLGKVGATQDLLRGIDKILPRKVETVTETVKETVVVQQGGGTNAAAFLKRGTLALEDGDWSKADGFFEEALNHDAECAEAYVGKFLVQKQKASLNAWAQGYLAGTMNVEATTANALEPNHSKQDKLVKQYAIKGFLDAVELEDMLNAFDRSYQVRSAGYKQKLDNAQRLFDQDKLLSRAFRFAKGSYAQELAKVKDNVLQTMKDRLNKEKNREADIRKERIADYDAHLEGCEKKFQKMHTDAQARREARYCKLVVEHDKAKTENEFRTLYRSFQQLDGYKDSEQRSQQCLTKANLLAKEAKEAAKRREEARQAELERQRKEKEKQEARSQAVATIVVLLVIAAIIGGIVFGIVAIVKSSRNKKQAKYDNAVSLFEQGKYDEAIEIFEGLKKFSDSKDRVIEVKYAKAEYKLEIGEGTAAAMVFGQIDGYKDAGTRSAELWDQYAKRDTIATMEENFAAVLTDGTVILQPGRYEEFSEDYKQWTDIVEVALTEEYLFGLKSDGTVVACGDNYSSPDMSKLSGIVAIEASESDFMALKRDGTVALYEGGFTESKRITDWCNIIDIALCDDFRVGLRDDGTVEYDGTNTYDQHLVDDWKDVTSIAVSWYNVVGLKKDGTVLVSGNDSWDQLDAAQWTDIKAIAGGMNFIVGIKNDGSIVEVGELVLPNDWPSNAVAIAAGERCMIAVTKDGNILANGWATPVGDVVTWTNVKVPQN